MNLTSSGPISGPQSTLERLARSKLFWSVIVALVLALNFARYFDSDQALRTDVRYFMHFATLVADGGVPYRDFFDNKTPLASFAGGAFVVAGRSVGLEDIHAIRMGYLGIAALAGLLCFWMFRSITQGSTIAALLGLMPYMAFTYIGSLASSGNVPKLVMATCATGAALAVGRGRWFLAGFVAAVGILDWQIGLFMCIGVAVAALMSGPATEQFVTECE